MEKITLKLFELYNLDTEINGATNQQTGEVISAGLLKEELFLTTKYWLTELGKKIAAEKAAIDEIRNELIRKYGKDDGKGTVTVPMFTDGTNTTLHPDFQAFDKEFGEFLQTEKELEYKSIPLEELKHIKTAGNYPLIFKLVKP